MLAKRPRGRPQVADRDKKTVRFTVSLTPDEAADFLFLSGWDTLSRAGRGLFLDELERMEQGHVEYAAWKASMDAKYGPSGARARPQTDEPANEVASTAGEQD